MDEDYYYNPEKTTYTFEERTGDPDTFSSGIGRIVLNFSHLESQLDTGIIQCLELDEERGRIITSELSFKNKVHLLSSLIKYLTPKWRFNTGDDDQLECWDKIVKQCFRSEEKRNQIMHSEWSGPYLRDMKANRVKYTAKAKKGLQKHIEPINSGDLLDIADYIIMVSVFVEEYFFVAESNNAVK